MQKKDYKTKILLFALCAILLFFFSNDFGLIDIEKTAIITAVAIDMEEDEYSVTAQIAVSENSTSKTENAKTQITGKGKTVGSAIKNIGDVSGWFPKMSFCNLIIVGKDLAKDNVITVLDYFSKTFRVQDSALVALSESKAKDLLTTETPMDNLSSFALQKIILKNPGFDSDVASVDIKTFCMKYYAPTSSAYMPLVKKNEQKDADPKEQGGGNNSGGTKTKGKTLFDASNTALFKDGKLVGQLTTEQTHCLNFFFDNVKNTTIEIPDVSVNGKAPVNYLLTVFNARPKIELTANEYGVNCEIGVRLYCKISDENSTSSDITFAENAPLPEELILKAQTLISNRLLDLIEISKETNCDFLMLNEKLYRFNHKYYDKYKDNLLSTTNFSVYADVQGQK